EVHQPRGCLTAGGVTASQARQAAHRLEQALIQFQMRADHDVLDGAHVHADLEVLESPAHTAACQLFRRHGCHVLPPEEDFSSSWDIDTGYEVEHRRLAGTIWSDDSMHL